MRISNLIRRGVKVLTLVLANLFFLFAGTAGITLLAIAALPFIAFIIFIAIGFFLLMEARKLEDKK